MPTVSRELSRQDGSSLLFQHLTPPDLTQEGHDRDDNPREKIAHFRFFFFFFRLGEMKRQAHCSDMCNVTGTLDIKHHRHSVYAVCEKWRSPMTNRISVAQLTIFAFKLRILNTHLRSCKHVSFPKGRT